MADVTSSTGGTTVWRNWAGDQACVPERFHRPASRDELRRIVAQEARTGRRVKVTGSGHSFTSAAMTGGAMIDIARLDRVLDVDRDAGLVRVEAGIVLGDLNEELQRAGLALPNLGDIDRQTLAGATQTGTHGTGARFNNISHQIEALELVTASGDVVEVDGGEELLAARIGIGALGAVSAVTLRCVPAFRLHRKDALVALEDVLDRFDELVDAHDHYEFFVFPGSDMALTVTRDATDAPLAPRSRIEEYVSEELVGNVLGNALLKLVRLRPSLADHLSSLATRLLSEGEYVDHSHRIFVSPRKVRWTEMEYAIPRGHAVEAIGRVLDVAAATETAMPVEVRVVAGDPALLSPTHERDSAYIAVHQYQGMAWEAYFREVEAICGEYDGRPHWGKRHDLDAETLRERYPRFDGFLAVRDRLDPERVFANAYTDRVLGR